MSLPIEEKYVITVISLPTVEKTTAFNYTNVTSYSGKKYVITVISFPAVKKKYVNKVIYLPTEKKNM